MIDVYIYITTSWTFVDLLFYVRQIERLDFGHGTARNAGPFGVTPELPATNAPEKRVTCGFGY